MESTRSFNKVLIANRGEIACRIATTCRALGFATVAVYSDVDRHARFVSECDEAIHLGGPTAYLDATLILGAAQRVGADAIHPGYGFLSENEGFARAVEDAGLVFIGPTPETIRQMGSKIEARRLMEANGVPVVPGYDGESQDDETLANEARRIGFPLLVKASAGGGGKGMRVVRDDASLIPALAQARREAKGAFGDETLLLERYIERPRHIEIQILGDAHGHLVHCFERECSIQRRHQKIIEETPAPSLDPELRDAIAAAALKVGELLSYRSAGTVEFILDPSGEFFFLEVNTRLQVEHPVTELTTGLDLVELQLAVAEGHPLPITQDEIAQEGHAIECRIYAEDPTTGFLPSTGTLYDWHFDDLEGLRVDSGVVTGDEVSVHYDPMLAKVITWGSTRSEATRRAVMALRSASIQGVRTNQTFLTSLLLHEGWATGETHTGFIPEHFPNLEEVGQVSPEVRIRAALVATLHRVNSRLTAARVLPGIPVGYRNNPWRDSEETWSLAGEATTVFYRSQGDGVFQMRVEETPCTLRLVAADGPEYDVEIDGYRARYRVVEGEGVTYVHHPNGSVALEAEDRFPDVDAEEAGAACVAPMPGKVLQVFVAVGDAVEEGAPVAILEAMKMEQTISAPRAAVVASVPVAVGDLVEADTALVTFESE